LRGLIELAKQERTQSLFHIGTVKTARRTFC
jgi:hypothetical protein